MLSDYFKNTMGWGEGQTVDAYLDDNLVTQITEADVGNVEPNEIYYKVNFVNAMSQPVPLALFLRK